MSGPSEDGRRDRNSGSAGSSNGFPPQAGPSSAVEERPQAPAEKTISCSSCRRRKLKCDRKKPHCASCLRLRTTCEYPTRRKNTGSNKRRNMKELEARLAQVETQLVSESKGAAPTNHPNGEPNWNDLTMDMNNLVDGVALDGSFDVPGYGFPTDGALDGAFLSQELISLGVEEPLPPDDMMDELHQIYFDKLYPTLPILHKFRYLAALSLPPHLRPPAGLRYAVFTDAACITDKYLAYEDIFYQRARKYLEAAEMKDHGVSFVSLYHAQAWAVIGAYEAKKTYFSRAWMSVGKVARLVQMLGLNNLDGEPGQSKKILPPPKDWIELEARRRTFWAAFHADRWASSSTGWPMILKEDEIMTNLPASEESYARGIAETTVSLADALSGEGVANISSFGAVILSACLFGHNFEHLNKKGPNERPDDLANGEFWKRHRKVDNVLVNTFMFLPDHLRMPGGARDVNVVSLHSNIHAASICLHQAAILKAERYGIDPGFIAQSKARSLMAAEEIANIMRLVSHQDAANMNSWTGFCLYVAGGVFIQNRRSENPSPSSLSHLEFLLAAMKAIGNRHSVTKHFTAQLELDIEGSGVMKPLRSIPNLARVQGPTVMNGHIGENRAPMIIDTLRSFSDTKQSTTVLGAEDVKMPQQSNGSIIPLYGVLPADRQNQSPHENSSATTPQFKSDVASVPFETIQQEPCHDSNLLLDHHSRFPPNNHSSASWPTMDSSPFMIDNSTPSDSSSSNTMQYAYRPADPNIMCKPSDEYGAYQYPTGLETFNTQPNWILAQAGTGQPNTLGQGGEGPNPMMDPEGWGHHHPPMN